MASGIDIGDAWINVVPSFKGMSRQISAEISKLSGTQLSQALGKRVTGGFVSNFRSAMAESSKAASVAARNVDVAMGKASAAVKAHADASELAKIANLKLSEATAKYGKDSSQAALASRNARVALAQESAAAINVKSAFERVASAKAIAADTRPLTRSQAAFQALAVSARSAASKIGGAFADTFRALPGLAAAGIAGVAGVIAANLGGAIQRADLLNAFPKTMANIGFSAEEAASQIKRISDSLDGLPTSTDAVVSVAKGLAPLTGNLTSATDVALALNDALLAGGASGELAANAMEQYRQMLAAGKVDMVAWRSMVSAMPGQMDQIAKSILGASAGTNELYEALQDGTVSFDDFNSALVSLDKEGINGLASFKEQATTASAGIGTAMSNVGNRIKKALASVIDAIGVDRIAGKINEMTSGIVGFGDQIAGVISGIMAGGGLESIGSVLSGLAPVIGGLGGALGPLLSGIPGLGGAFTSLTGPVGMVIGLFVGMIQNSQALQAAFGTAFGVLGQVLAAAAPVIGQIMTVVGQLMGQLGDALAPVIVMIATSVGNLLSGVLPMLPPLIAGIGVVIGALMPIISRIVAIIAENLMTMIPMLVPIIGQVIGVIMQVISAIAPLIVQIGTVLIPIIEALMPVVQAVFSTVMNVVSAAMTVVSGIIQTVTAVIAGDWQGAWEGIKQIFSGVWDAIKAVVTGAIDIVRSYIDYGMTFIKTIWGAAWNWVSSWASNVWASVTSAVSRGVISMMGFIIGIPGRIQGVFANAGSWLLDAGRKIIEGFVNGIRNAIGSVKDTLSNLTSMLPSWKGPEDLDKVILRDAGQLVIGGFVSGMESQYNEARKSLNKFTGNLAPSMGYEVRGMPSSYGTDDGFVNRRLYFVVDGREFSAYVTDVQAEALSPASRSRARELMGV